MTFDDFVSRLDGVKRRGTGVSARCPAHEDRHASLGVNEGDDGRVLVRCYAGCETEAVVKALGLEVSDLFDKPAGMGDPQAIYDYVDENGELVMQSLRYPKPEGGKQFRQRRPATDAEKLSEGGDWVWKLDGVERVPYRLPEVLEAVRDRITVYITEGEKDADALVARGKVATCNPGGAGKWQHSWSEKYFRGATVIIVADADEAGTSHARMVRDSLVTAGAKVYVVRAKTGKDAYDHFRAGHDFDDFVPLELDVVTDGLVLMRAEELEIEDVEWVAGFENYIPYGGISMIFGHPGVNKSTLTCRLAALVTLEGSDVIFLSAEDNPGRVMKPRLFVAGADLKRVHFLGKRSGGTEDQVMLPHDSAALEALIEKYGVRLLIIDPIDSALGLDVDSYKAQAVRYALTPLHGVAQRHNVAIVMVSHLNQEKSSDPMRRAGGSRFTGLARACSIMGRDKDDLENGRILASFKNSWGRIPNKSRIFKLEQAPVPGRDEPAVKIYDFGTSPATAKGLLYEPKDES